MQPMVNPHISVNNEEHLNELVGFCLILYVTDMLAQIPGIENDLLTKTLW